MIATLMAFTLRRSHVRDYLSHSRTGQSRLCRCDADAVMFELQDLPCVHHAGVSLADQTAWIDHSTMISPGDIVPKLLEAGYDAHIR